jgi:hypothetical protein
MNFTSANRPPPRNVSELRDHLQALGIEVLERTLMRWADNGLITPPAWPQSRRRRLWSAAPWQERAVWEAAGVWTIRNGSRRHWSRRILSKTTLKKVQRAAAESYEHPTLLLSLPDNTKEEDDPQLDAVAVALECAPNVAPFLRPYLIAFEKARHGWTRGKAATVSFEWAESAKGAKGEEATRELVVSVTEALHGKDELRFLVGGKDVREHFLEHRQTDRELISKHGPEYRTRVGGVPNGAIWPLASHPIQLGDDTWEEVYEKYKKGEVPERERMSRKLWAYNRELAREAKSDKRD